VILLKETTLDLRGTDIVCKIQLDEASISGYKHEFPTLILNAQIKCPRVASGKLTIIEVNGNLQRAITGNFVTYFTTNLMLEVESYEIDKPFDIIIPLTFTQIERLEKYREGNDLEIRVNMALTYYYFWNDSRTQRLIANSIMSKTNEAFIDLRIPQSDWVKFLNVVGYNNIRILEMNFPKNIGNKQIDKMFNYLVAARNYYFNGDYNKAIGECRRVVEDIPRLYKVPSDLKIKKFAIKIDYFITEYLIKKIDSRITDHLRETAIHLWSFCSKFLHNLDEPDINPIVAKRADAEYIINQSIDLAVYLSKII